MIWVIGCKGMLGQEICKQLTDQDISWIGTDSDVDITDFSSIDTFIQKFEAEAFYKYHSRDNQRINYIINCAAYTAVEKAEENEELAYKLNVVGPRNIARAARKINAKLVHFSTDYVFDGSAKQPYTEDTPKCPLGVYGKTKSEGEDEIEKEMTQYYIIRTAWLYGFNRPNFVYTMLKLMNTHESIKVVNDQIGSPTFTADLSDVVIKIIQMLELSQTNPLKYNVLPYGIYNYTNAGMISWYDFANEIYTLGRKYKLITNECNVNPCTTEEYGAKVKRPAYSYLSKDKILSRIKIKIPDWKTSLEKFLKSKQLFSEAL